MSMVYINGDNVITSLGFTTAENVLQIEKNICGIELHDNKVFSPVPVYLSTVDTLRLEKEFKNLSSGKEFTRLEKLLLLSVRDALNRSSIDGKNENTLIIFSTTKGNIDLLDADQARKYGDQRIHLWSVANEVARYFQNPNTPITISNACISGSLAIITGQRLIESGKYKHVIITGGDIMSEFVVSGFQSFQAISEKPCKPFDKNRTGITIGEGAATIILSSEKSSNVNGDRVGVVGGGSSNDANHISGPSRTGDGLYYSIMKAFKEARITANDIDYISAHGTGTDYNDEMEAKAIASASMTEVPVNSFKGYIGHTLGAAGIIESIYSIQSLLDNTLYTSMGFSKPGVSEKLNVIEEIHQAPLETCLKLASGFGGCNAAVVYRKE